MLEEDRESLAHESWHAQYLWIADVAEGKVKPMVDMVLRHENLDADFAQLTAFLGAGDRQLPHVNKTERTSYRDYYDDTTREIVTRVYQADITLFGYTF